MHSNRVELSINLNNLRKNIHSIRNISNCNLIVMIKANAYGHGLVEVYQYLKDFCDVKYFGVASIEEALYLRKATKDYDTSIIVFSDIAFSNYVDLRDFIDHKVIPLISSWEDLDFFIHYNQNCTIPLFLKLNTGMNRLGLSYHSEKELVRELKKRGIKNIGHLMTHFSSANSKIDPTSKCWLQNERFKKAKKAIQDSDIVIEDTSVSNSGAIEQGFGFEETFVRPGLITYGVSALDLDVRDMSVVKTSLVSSMTASVIDSFMINKDAEIGYGDMKVDTTGKIILIGVGYGDGLSSRFSGSTVNYGEEIGKIVGKINMDMTAILFASDLNIKKGARLEIWGEDSRCVNQISDEVGIIPYEILCNIGDRVGKDYII